MSYTSRTSEMTLEKCNDKKGGKKSNLLYCFNTDECLEREWIKYRA